MPIEYFFEDVDRAAIGGNQGTISATPDFLSNDESLRLAIAIMRVADPKVRGRIVDLVKSLAEEGAN